MIMNLTKDIERLIKIAEWRGCPARYSQTHEISRIDLRCLYCDGPVRALGKETS